MMSSCMTYYIKFIHKIIDVKIKKKPIRYSQRYIFFISIYNLTQIHKYISPFYQLDRSSWHSNTVPNCKCGGCRFDFH